MPPSSPQRAVPPPPAPEASAPRAADLANPTSEKGGDSSAAGVGDAVLVPKAPSGSAPVPASVAGQDSTAKDTAVKDTTVDSVVEGVAALSVTGDGVVAAGGVSSPLEKPATASNKIFGSPSRHKTPAKSELRRVVHYTSIS